MPHDAPALPFAPGRAPRLPLWSAPMAGGPSTTALVAAVGRAGGLGVVPGGYLGAAELAARMDEAAASGVPWGVNLFLPGPRAADPAAVAAHGRALAPWAARHGVALGEPRWDDDDLGAKVDAVLARRPAVVTWTFGVPAPALVARVRERTGAVVAGTATTPSEAVRTAEAGVDAVVLQGAEAGGHRGTHVDDPTHPAGGELVGTLDLVARTRRETSLPLVAAGGLMDGVDVRAALDAGASAVVLGTALLAAPEAGTSPTHRRAILERTYDDTVVTRAFTGRPAQGLANPLARGFPDAPSAYPEIHHLTRPLRAAAARAGDADALHLWAGTGWRRATEEPAGDLIARLAREAGL